MEDEDCRTVYDTVFEKKCEMMNVTVPQTVCQEETNVIMETKYVCLHYSSPIKPVQLHPWSVDRTHHMPLPASRPQETLSERTHFVRRREGGSLLTSFGGDLVQCQAKHLLSAER